LFLETSPAPVKYALSLMKRCSPSIRLPLVEVENFASKNKILFENNKVKVNCACLKHKIPAYGYRVSE